MDIYTNTSGGVVRSCWEDGWYSNPLKNSKMEADGEREKKEDVWDTKSHVGAKPTARGLGSRKGIDTGKRKVQDAMKPMWGYVV